MRGMRRLVFLLTVALVVLALYAFQRGGQPDPSLINLAVRATVYAMPSPAPRIVEVTRVVQVTVEVVRMVEVTPTPLPASPTPTVTATPLAAAPTVAAVALASLSTSDSQSDAVQAASIPVADNSSTARADTSSGVNSGGCPVSSNNQYTSIPALGGPLSHPDSQHGDLNLSLRGYVPTDSALSLIDINGPADGDAPQLVGVLGRVTAIGQDFQVRDWNWACGGAGCRGDPLTNVAVSLIGLQSNPGDVVYVPSRGAEIYGGGFVAMVLYADTSQLTVVYTREDSVANGYAVHLEQFCVDPNLLALYHADNDAGRGSLPAIHNGEMVGTAQYNHVLVGVRDRGEFTDPRSRKDWWQGN